VPFTAQQEHLLIPQVEQLLVQESLSAVHAVGPQPEPLQQSHEGVVTDMFARRRVGNRAGRRLPFRVPDRSKADVMLRVFTINRFEQFWKSALDRLARMARQSRKRVSLMPSSA